MTRLREIRVSLRIKWDSSVRMDAPGQTRISWWFFGRTSWFLALVLCGHQAEGVEPGGGVGGVSVWVGTAAEAEGVGGGVTTIRRAVVAEVVVVLPGFLVVVLAG